MTTETLRIELAPGATLEVPMRQVAIALMGQAANTPISVASVSSVPRIGDFWPGQGGEYAGVARGRDGQPDYRLIVGPEYDGESKWYEAVKWAKELKLHGFDDFSLPTRKEQALLFANVSDLFKTEWYWSCEQHAGDSVYAWHQYFGYGSQGYDLKSNSHRVRVVRRLPIQ